MHLLTVILFNQLINMKIIAIQNYMQEMHIRGNAVLFVQCCFNVYTILKHNTEVWSIGSSN